MNVTLKHHRRFVLGSALALAASALLILLFITQSRGPEPPPAAFWTPDYWPTQAWRTSTPEEQGIDSAILADGLLAIRQQNINIHSVLIVRNGSLVLDAYFYPYDGKTYHELASVTKSLTTSLIGIAAGQGKLNLDAPALSFFPDRTIANRDARKERMTVRHLASMANGMESVCMANDEGTLQEMQASSDWVQFALDRRMTSEPGTTFCYDSPGMHLLSAILQQATGMTELEFARRNLFEPLGIRDVLWPADPQGYSRGWGEVYLYPADAAKLGYLWAAGGMWEGKQIVSREWVQNSVKVQSTTGMSQDYGYGWWVASRADPPYYEAQGRGGQRVYVQPALNLLVVYTGGGFEPDDAGRLLRPALVDMSEPLPPNPAGVAKLNAALAAIAQPPAAQPVAPLPALAREISGKTFVIEPNAKQVRTWCLTFDDSAEAGIRMTFADNQPARAGGVGLDGVYRFSPGRNNVPAGYRGAWTDAQTFVLELDEIASRDAYTLNVRFAEDRVVITGRERTHEASFTLNGSLQQPADWPAFDEPQCVR